RVETEISPRDGHSSRRGVARIPNLAVGSAVGRLDSGVAPPEHAAHPEMRRAEPETREHDAALICDAVAVAVFEEKDVRRRGHEDSAPEREAGAPGPWGGARGRD